VKKPRKGRREIEAMILRDLQRLEDCRSATAVTLWRGMGRSDPREVKAITGAGGDVPSSCWSRARALLHEVRQQQEIVDDA
jgi:hypothetical protein